MTLDNESLEHQWLDAFIASIIATPQVHDNKGDVGFLAKNGEYL